MKMIKDKISLLENKKNWLFLVGIAGIILIGLSEIFSGGSEKSVQSSATETYSESAYREKMEQQLAEILSQVEGAGEVKVMLTLESGPETVYAQNQQSQTSTREETDGSLQKESSFPNEHILLDNNSGKQALVEEQLTPEIKGAAVVCSGGDDIEVIERITELVSVVLDLPSNRICVTKKI